MKTLKKNNEIKRVKDSSVADHKSIDQMLKFGWEFCTKKEWKKVRPEKVEKVKKVKAVKK